MLYTSMEIVTMVTLNNTDDIHAHSIKQKLKQNNKTNKHLWYYYFIKNGDSIKP
jgi:hypothetical protein